MKQIVVIITLFTFIVNILNAQDDKMIWDDIKRDAELVEYHKKFIEPHFNKVLMSFCSFKKNQYRDSIITHLEQYPELYSKDHFLDFAYRNARCLQESQKETVKRNIQSMIRPFERNFHVLVCKYKISSFNEFLYRFANVEDLKQIRANFLNNGISSTDILLLKSLATLSVLGDKSIDSEILSFIHDIFLESKAIFDKKPQLMTTLYMKIIPSTIALFESKSSVINTLYLFENDLNVGSGHSAKIYFDNQYYSLIIKPKIDPNIWIYIRPKKMKEKRKEIIFKILNDDSIWLDHMKNN